MCGALARASRAVSRPGDTIATLGLAGTPTASDARRVIESGVRPVINVRIAHREPGVAQIGAGIARPPLDCFVDAVRELEQRLGIEGTV